MSHVLVIDVYNHRVTADFWCYVCQRTSHIYLHTPALSFVSTMRNCLSSHTLWILCNFKDRHALFPYPQCHWHSWLLGCSRETKTKRNTLILPDCSLPLMTTSLHTLSAVDTACSYRHATLDIARVTCGPSCPTAPRWAHAKGKTVFGFPSDLTLNIWDRAVKA